MIANKVWSAVWNRSCCVILFVLRHSHSAKRQVVASLPFFLLPSWKFSPRQIRFLAGKPNTLQFRFAKVKIMLPTLSRSWKKIVLYRQPSILGGARIIELDAVDVSRFFHVVKSADVTCITAFNSNLRSVIVLPCWEDLPNISLFSQQAMPFTSTKSKWTICRH